MVMDRRGFMATAMAAGAAVAGTTLAGTTVYAGQATGLVTLPPTIHVLGAPAEDLYARIVKQLSDDVFVRLCADLEGRQYYVTNLQHIGESETIARFGEVTLTQQWNTAFAIQPLFLSDRPAPFPVEAFRAQTDTWVDGHLMYAAQGDDDRETVRPRIAFGDKRAVGMPFLPEGMLWAAHYVDERTGMVMRVVAQFDVRQDLVNVRWDVVCG